MAPEVGQGFHGRRAGAEGHIRKGKDSGPSRVAKCNVNPRTGTVIFLFPVTPNVLDVQIHKRERERLDRGQLREGDAKAETLKVAARGGRRVAENHRHQEREKHKTGREIEVTQPSK